MRGSREDSAGSRFAREVGRAIAVDLTRRAVYGVVGVLLAGVALLIWQGGSLPAWTAALAFAAPAVAAWTVRAPAARRLRGELEADRDALERHETYSGHVAQALDALQRIVAGDIAVDISHYIGVGVLEPARDLITDKPADDVRLSILLPREDGERWSMRWAAGHSLEGRAKYKERIVDTLSRHAYELGETQRWSDVTSDSGFRQNRLASQPIRAMLSLPVRAGDQTVGVFNVVSSAPGAFDPAEEIYITSLGAVISVAVGVLKDRLHQASDPERA
jgi:GAF domain-containing protein